MPKNNIGQKNGHWKGGIITRNDGYILVRKPGLKVNSKGAGYKLLHRVVVENKLGRKLLENEVVHHKNGNNKDNGPDNLAVTNQSEHAREHYYKRKINSLGQFT